MSWLARLIGRRYNPADGAFYDHTVAVTKTTNRTGVLQVYVLEPAYLTSVTLMRTYWFMHRGGSSSAPFILKKVEVCNPTAAAITFRLAIMSVSDGTPATSNAFLAWDYSLGANGVWTWDGEVPLSGRYFYAKAASSGLTILTSYYTGTA